MAIAVVANTGKAGAVNGGTTDAIDTTGASLIVVGVPFYNSTGFTLAAGDITDSKGNTYASLTQFGNGSALTGLRLFYCAAPSVGSGHTVTVSHTGSYPSIFVLALSGTHGTPFDVQAGADSGASGASSLQPGSITPGQDNEIVIAACYHLLATTPSVDSGMTVANNVNFNSGVNVGGTLAYKIQTTAAAINPTFSTGSALIYVAAQASFKVAATNTTITPATLSLATARFAPTVSTPRLVTPGTAALNTTLFAPTVSTPRLVTPGTAALNTTLFAPTVSTPRLVTPGTVPLVLTTFAPSVQTPRIVTPSTTSLMVRPFAPSVQTPRIVTPSTIAVTTAMFAPSVQAPQLVTPATLSLATARFAPTVSTPRLVTPGTAALNTTLFAPTVSTPRLVTPGTVPLVLTTFAPSVPTALVLTPETASLVLTMYAPTVRAPIPRRMYLCDGRPAPVFACDGTARPPSRCHGRPRPRFLLNGRSRPAFACDGRPGPRFLCNGDFR